MEYFQELGYLGLFIASFLSATILPLGSEAIFVFMLLGGYNVFYLLFCATIGNTLGGMTNYYIGHLGKKEWIEKYLKISKEKIERAEKYIEKYGHLVSFFCFLPIVGDPLAVVLGLVKADYKKVIMFMFLGKLVRYGLLVAVKLF